MFHLIGVSHRAQMKDKDAEETEFQKDFRACLEQAIKEIRPALVAEELSDYALKKVGLAKGKEQVSLTKEIADLASVKHRFCDPNDIARLKMGYVEGSQIALNLALTSGEDLSNEEINLRGFATEIVRHWPSREKFWLDQLGDACRKTVIFVCGDAHVESFRALLKQHDIDSSIVKRHIGVTEYDDKFSDAIQTYIQRRPDLFR